MSSVEEMGNKAYQKAIWNDFKGAISILNKAIARYPNDPRLYNNRSYCYCQLKDYKSALSDAEYMIKEFPDEIRGYYRKAEIFQLTKKYNDSELYFRKVLKMNPNCEEAKIMLEYVQINSLRDGGKYSVTEAMKALSLTDSNTIHAKEFLELGGMKGVTYSPSEIYYSDDEVDEASTSGAVDKITTEEADYDPYVDPKNPYKSCSIWVGNVTSKITDEVLKLIFSKYGKIKSVVVQQQNFCAFVNYMDSNMAANAMKKFQQHYPVADTNLVIRFPDNVSKSGVVLGNKKNGLKIK